MPACAGRRPAGHGRRPAGHGQGWRGRGGGAGVEAASCKVCCWRGEITWTSSAAGRPRFQVGRSTSAGLEWESGTTLGASLVGAKAADWAAKNRTSRSGVARGGALGA